MREGKKLKQHSRSSQAHHCEKKGRETTVQGGTWKGSYAAHSNCGIWRVSVFQGMQFLLATKLNQELTQVTRLELKLV